MAPGPVACVATDSAAVAPRDSTSRLGFPGRVRDQVTTDRRAANPAQREPLADGRKKLSLVVASYA